MCGFFSLAEIDVYQLKREFSLSSDIDDGIFSLKYSPSAMIPTVSKNSPNQLVMRRWWLIPKWYKDDPLKMKFTTFNARSEDIESKPAYVGPWKNCQRCLIPATWFYEFESVDEGETKPKKVPFKISVPETDVFGIAGLWESWIGAESVEIQSCTMLTCASTAPLSRIHERQPIIVPRNQWEQWLSTDTTPQAAKELLKPWKDLKMERIDERFNKATARQLSENPELLDALTQS